MTPKEIATTIANKSGSWTPSDAIFVAQAYLVALEVVEAAKLTFRPDDVGAGVNFEIGCRKLFDALKAFDATAGEKGERK